MRLNRGYVAVAKAEQIERMNQNDCKKPVIPGVKHHSKNCSGICLLCGLRFNMITKAHAAKHNFDSPEKMIDAGKVRWM